MLAVKYVFLICMCFFYLHVFSEVAEHQTFLATMISLKMCLICRDVHAVCLWDDKGPAKIHQALKEDILDFIKQAQAVCTVYQFFFIRYNKMKFL